MTQAELRVALFLQRLGDVLPWEKLWEVCHEAVRQADMRTLEEDSFSDRERALAANLVRLGAEDALAVLDQRGRLRSAPGTTGGSWNGTRHWRSGSRPWRWVAELREKYPDLCAKAEEP